MQCPSLKKLIIPYKNIFNTPIKQSQLNFITQLALLSLQEVAELEK
jgi:hypothetical protein